jgi:hypothetical protein
MKVIDIKFGSLFIQNHHFNLDLNPIQHDFNLEHNFVICSQQIYFFDLFYLDGALNYLKLVGL